MPGKMVVTVPGLEDRHRMAIREAAEKAGYSVLFFQDSGEAREALKDADIIFGHGAELSAAAPKLKWICTPFAGADAFVKPGAFVSPEAVLTNSSGAYGVTISEHVIMVSLEIFRRQAEYNEIVRQREWKRDLPIRSLKGCRVTLMGTGDIGRECARRLRAFGPAVLNGMNRNGTNPEGLFDRIVTEEELDAVLRETDLLILSLPGTRETEHLLNRHRLGLLPDQAAVVNVGRGSVIDQTALKAELEAGRLWAALDVFETEPLPREDPLWACSRLLLTPHVAGNMSLKSTLDEVVRLFLENLALFREGKQLRRRVDLKKGY